MIIFAVQDDFGWLSTGNEFDPTVLEFCKANKIDEVVDWIYQTWAENPGYIECLFLCAHGNSGKLFIGNDLGVHRATKFAKLKGTFTANSRGIEIHGCACASSTEIGWFNSGTPSASGKGYDFLKSLAVSAGVKVTAPIDGVWGFNAGYSYQGVRTMTVLPSGSVYFSYGD